METLILPRTASIDSGILIFLYINILCIDIESIENQVQLSMQSVINLKFKTPLYIKLASSKYEEASMHSVTTLFVLIILL